MQQTILLPNDSKKTPVKRGSERWSNHISSHTTAHRGTAEGKLSSICGEQNAYRKTYRLLHGLVPDSF